MKGYVSNIEHDTLKNKHFRKVLYTTEQSQLVLMSLRPGEDIGKEVHEEHDQFFRVESGHGEIVLDDAVHSIEDGSAMVVPAGTEHNVRNTSESESLKLYTLYTPPEHRLDTRHATKAEALADAETFDGVTSE